MLSEKKREIYFTTSLICMLAILYGGSANAPLLAIDDATHFLIPQFTQPLSWLGLQTIFTPGSHVDYYPVRDLSYWLDYQIWGQQWAGWRLQQIGLFAGIALFLHGILRMLRINPWISIAVTTAWALNPSHVEMVLWLTARKDLWMMFLGCASAWSFIRASKRNSTPLFALSVLLYLLTNLSKAGLVLLPLVGWTAWALGFIQNARKKSLYTLAVAAPLALSFGLFGRWYYSNIYVQTYPIDWFKRLSTALTALAREITGWFDPSANIIDLMSWGEWLDFNQTWTRMGYALALIALAGAAYAGYKRNRLLILFFASALSVYLPSSGIVFSNRNLYSIRYTEPLFIAVLIFGVYAWANSKTRLQTHRFSKLIGLASLAFLLVASGMATLHEARLWATPIKYLLKGVEQQPESVRLRIAALQQIQSRFALEEISPQEQEKQSSEMIEAIHEICERPTRSESGATCDLFWRKPPLGLQEFSTKYPQSSILYESWVPPRRLAYQQLIESIRSGSHPQTSARALLEQMPENWQTTSDERIYYWAAQCLAGAQTLAKMYLEKVISRHLVDADRIESLQSIATGTSLAQLKDCR